MLRLFAVLAIAGAVVLAGRTSYVDAPTVRLKHTHHPISFVFRVGRIPNSQRG